MSTAEVITEEWRFSSTDRRAIEEAAAVVGSYADDLRRIAAQSADLTDDEVAVLIEKATTEVETALTTLLAET